MLEILVALILAVGFFILGTLFYRKDISSEKTLGLLILSIGLIGMGSFIIIFQLGIFTVSGDSNYQPGYLVPIIMLTGLLLLFLGIYWILF